MLNAARRAFPASAKYEATQEQYSALMEQVATKYVRYGNGVLFVHQVEGFGDRTDLTLDRPIDTL